MESIEGATDVQLRSPTGTPLLQVRLRLDRLASFGLRPMEVIEAMQIAYDLSVEIGWEQGIRMARKTSAASQ